MTNGIFTRRIIGTSIFLFYGFLTFAQEFDLVIKNGHLIDPKNNFDQHMDIAIKEGKIAKVAPQIRESAKSTVDAEGLYVFPGLIDIHAHVFWGTKPDAYISNSYTSLPPDGFTFRAGVTTVVDAGGAGWKNFRIFKEQTIDHANTRVLAFINIVGSGMKGGAIEQNLLDMDPKLTAIEAKKYRDYIVGIKLAHYSGPEWDPLERTVKAGVLADIPVMIDFGGHQPELSLEKLLMEKLRPGDIFTHCYAHVKGRIPLVNEDGKLEDFALEAQKRGIIFDVGHGGGSFRFDQAVPAIAQGLKPNSISTDLHTGSMNGGMKDMANVMSKLLNLGLSLQEVIEASTWKPAQIIKREQLGHLGVGAAADISLFRLEQGSYGYIDVVNKRINGDKKLVCELTILGGAVVWDLNGLNSEAYPN
ncbi:MAG: amidohydrolase/deacetylase family metallohydrolase [Cytophagales bacterium]|nr:amidohydrolase/deacetylase family metallohydrolase [Cytophagales bacterium]